MAGDLLKPTSHAHKTNPTYPIRTQNIINLQRRSLDTGTHPNDVCSGINNDHEQNGHFASPDPIRSKQGVV